MTSPTTTVAEHAARYATVGLRVLPVRADSKQPSLPSWATDATTDPETVAGWFPPDSRHNVGLALGDWGGVGWLFALDVDTHKGDGFIELRQLVDRHGPLPVTWEQHTGSGGMHLVYRSPVKVTNSAKRLPPNIDVRGAGGQIIAAPSTVNGKPYRWTDGRAPWDIKVADAPTWLVALLTTPEPERTRTTTVERHNSPADRLRATWDWPTELRRQRWQPAKDTDDDYWVRPGKNPADGHSAVLHDGGPLVVFTTEISPALQRVGKPTADGSGYSFSPFDWYSAHQHDGDTRAASRALNVDPVTGELNDTASPVSPSFQPVNLADVISGGVQQPRPTILRMDDDRALLYPGEINMLFGDSGHGKGWVSLYAVHQQLVAGHNCLLIDLEDNAPSIVARLRLIGTPERDIVEHLTYIRAADPFTRVDVDHLCDLATDRNVTLTVIDSLGEAFSVEGINENADHEAGPWLRRVARRLADTGSGVLLIDHVTKAGDNPLHPSGTKRKRAATGGAAYLIKARRPLTAAAGGSITITAAKDRHGNYRTGETVARLDVNVDLDGTRFTLTNATTTNSDEELPVLLAARAAVRAARDEGGDLSQATLVELVKIKAATQTKRAGIDLAVSRGALVETVGPRNARLFRYVRDLADG